MYKRVIRQCWAVASLPPLAAAGAVPTLVERAENPQVPTHYSSSSSDTTNMAVIRWQDYFTDPYLTALIDTALMNTQELNITTQKIAVTQNEVRKGEYLLW